MRAPEQVHVDLTLRLQETGDTVPITRAKNCLKKCTAEQIRQEEKQQECRLFPTTFSVVSTSDRKREATPPRLAPPWDKNRSNEGGCGGGGAEAAKETPNLEFRKKKKPSIANIFFQPFNKNFEFISSTLISNFEVELTKFLHVEFQKNMFYIFHVFRDEGDVAQCPWSSQRPRVPCCPRYRDLLESLVTLPQQELR